MKKTLLALAVAAMATSTVASAANVYDKDGTSLTVGGRVQSVFYSGSNVYNTGNNDGSIINSSRLSLDGRSEIASGITAFGFAEWNLSNGDSSNETSDMEAREQYIGVDFGNYGVLTVGRTFDTLNNVIAATDIFEDFGVVGQFASDDRRAGVVKYIWEGYGLTAGASYQSAKDNAYVGGAIGNDRELDDTVNVESGFSALLGYTSPVVGFGPISAKTAYAYLKGQDDQKGALSNGIDNVKDFAASLSWGADTGLYLAALYNQRTISYLSDNNVTGIYDVSYKGIEAVVAYYFENGLSVATGWEYMRSKAEDTDGVDAQFINRKIPVFVNYDFNNNFRVWAEAQFDAGSDRQVNYNGAIFANSDFEANSDSTLFSVGARYTF